MTTLEAPASERLYHSERSYSHAHLFDWSDRFFRFVTVTDGCWEWGGYRTKKGYGTFELNGRPRRAHRLGWLLETGEQPPAQVLHHCDNPPCVRPSCLFSGTHGDNMRDMATKGRGTPWPVLRGEANGNSRLTSAQVEEIRGLYAAGGITQTALAHEFEVSQSLVSGIVRGDKW